MAYEVAAGMTYLHGLEPSPIIHGDLKLQNVLLNNYFNAKVWLVSLEQLILNCEIVKLDFNEDFDEIGADKSRSISLP